MSPSHCCARSHRLPFDSVARWMLSFLTAFKRLSPLPPTAAELAWSVFPRFQSALAASECCSTSYPVYSLKLCCVDVSHVHPVTRTPIPLRAALAVEEDIVDANRDGSRPYPYVTLLPSLIPQSINI